MAIKRGPDGVPIEEPSVKVSVDSSDEAPTQTASTGDEEPTIKGFETSAPKPGAHDSLFLDDPPTVPAKMTPPPPVAKPDDVTIKNEKIIASAPSASNAPTVQAQTGDAEPATTVAGFGRGASAQAQAQTTRDPMTDPVAGWLIVIAGPGKGHILNIGYGQNSIGRGDSERITLNFGDSDISRSNHFTVTYDARGKVFYIQPGTGTNLTYLEGETTPLLSPKVLEPFSHISVGATTLRFVPLCGESFHWDA